MATKDHELIERHLEEIYTELLSELNTDVEHDGYASYAAAMEGKVAIHQKRLNTIRRAWALEIPWDEFCAMEDRIIQGLVGQ